jgi:tellurite resistance-related uncharacterized protein
MADITLPEGLELARTTPEFDEVSVPAALRRAHRVAAGTWGNIRVLEGSLRFRLHGEQELERILRAGDTQPIPPLVAHDVEPVGTVRFVVEFWK